MKKYISILLYCIPFILSACSQIEEYSKDDGKAMSYEYTVTKEGQTYYWEIGYRGDKTTIEEKSDNQEELLNYRKAINNSKEILLKLILSISFFIIVAIILFILYRKNRKMLKEGAIFLVLASIIALSITFTASLDLKNALADLNYYYLRLTN